MTAANVAVRGFGYRPAGRSHWALRDVNFSISAGERVLLLGDSGSGKSTLLRALAGLLRTTGERSGDTLIDGETADSSRHRVGLLLQDPDAGLVLSRAGEDVAFGPQNRGLPRDEVARLTAEALEAVGFAYDSRREIHTLSGGERQRLALAGVLALSPGLMLLDEPTSLLDPEGAALVRDTVSRIAAARQVTLIVVEHRVADWIDRVDRVMVLKPSGVVADGAPADVSANPAADSTWLRRQEPLAASPPNPTDQLLVAESVGYRYRDSTKPALCQTDCHVVAGSVLAITGPNGSGKSTLGFLLGGLATPTDGRVRATPALVDANSLRTAPHRWSASELAGRIGTVFQNPEHSFLTGSVGDELAIGPAHVRRSTTADDGTVDQLIERLRLSRLTEANPFTLSGGEQRRLSVAAALVVAPRVLILDEPTFGQDPQTWHEMASLILELRDEGAAVVIITHDLDLVTATADRSLQLNEGHPKRAAPDAS